MKLANRCRDQAGTPNSPLSGRVPLACSCATFLTLNPARPTWSPPRGIDPTVAEILQGLLGETVESNEELVAMIPTQLEQLRESLQLRVQNRR